MNHTELYAIWTRNDSSENDSSHANANVIVQNHGLVLKGSDCKTTDTLKINNRVNSTKDILTLFKPHDQGSRDGNEGPVPSRSKGVTN